MFWKQNEPYEMMSQPFDQVVLGQRIHTNFDEGSTSVPTIDQKFQLEESSMMYIYALRHITQITINLFVRLRRCIVRHIKTMITSSWGKFLEQAHCSWNGSGRRTMDIQFSGEICVVLGRRMQQPWKRFLKTFRLLNGICNSLRANIITFRL